MNKRQRKKASQNAPEQAPRQLTAQEAWDALAPHLEKNGKSLSYFASYSVEDGKWALRLRDIYGFELISHNVKGYGVKSHAG